MSKTDTWESIGSIAGGIAARLKAVREEIQKVATVPGPVGQAESGGAGGLHVDAAIDGISGAVGGEDNRRAPGSPKGVGLPPAAERLALGIRFQIVAPRHARPRHAPLYSGAASNLWARA